jgi:hypothetical protein
MITWVRTANISDGKLQEAFSWAVKVAGYINKKFEGVNVQVVRNVGGPVFQVHWVATYKSLASFEEKWKQIDGDEGYQGLLAEIRQQAAFIGTSIVDSLYETVS